MKNCIGVIVLSLVFSGMAYSADLPKEAVADTENLCREEHTNRGKLDQSLFKFCIQKHRDGYANLKKLSKKYGKEPWFEEALQFSVDKWTERGLRSDLGVASEMRRICDGYEDIKYMSKQPNWDQAKFDNCKERFGIQLGTVIFCYKKGY